MSTETLNSALKILDKVKTFTCKSYIVVKVLFEISSKNQITFLWVVYI